MSATEPGWGTTRIATRVWRFGTVASTQMEAKRLIEQGQGDGALVLAASQTAGRGRLSRRWHSPPGNLYLSVAFRPALPLARWSALTLAAALALVEALDAVGVKGVSVKWPNDILAQGRKVAGILAEVEDEWLVLGAGVNVNGEVPDDLPGATSLRTVMGAPVSFEDLLRQFAERLDALIVALERGERLGARWATRMETLGRWVRLGHNAGEIEGQAESVGDDGALMVRCTDGSLVACYGGEIRAAAPASAGDELTGGAGWT